MARSARDRAERTPSRHLVDALHPFSRGLPRLDRGHTADGRAGRRRACGPSGGGRTRSTYGPHRKFIIQNWVLDVPEAYAHTNEALCFIRAPDARAKTPARNLTPRCVPSFRGSDRLVKALTYEFRGTPHLYGLLGLPSLIWPDRVSMYLMRALNALVCAAFLASACVSALRRPRRRLSVVGVLAAASPMVWYLGGIINPNGIEIAAAISLWAMILALAAHDSIEPDGRLVHRAGVAAFALVSIRGLGPGWVIAAVVICAVVAEPRRMRALTRLRSTRVWAGLVVASTALTAAWVIHAPLGDQLKHPAIGLRDAVAGLPTILRQSVGVFGTDYMPLPRSLDIGWGLVAVAAVGVGLVVATSRQRIALLGTIVASAVLPITTDGLNIPSIGFPWQGRYGLPLTVGIVVIAFGVIPSRTRLVRWGGVLGGSMLLLGQVGAFVAIGRRLAMGHPHGANIFDYVADPLWNPPISNAVLLAVFTAVVGGLGIILLRPLIRPPTGPDALEPVP